MRRMTKLAAAGAGLALIAGAAVATPALAATAHRDGGAACASWPGALWSQLPADLRQDLREARSATPGPERQAAFAAIREGALAGEYGDAVEGFAQAHPGLGAGLWRDAPEELKDAVRAALALPIGQRAEAFAAIGRDAAAGVYGPAVQERARQAQDAPWWPDCQG